MGWRLGLALLAALAGASAATQFLAGVFGGHAALGAPLVTLGKLQLYAPWRCLDWDGEWAARFPRAFAVSRLILFASTLVSLGLVARAVARRGAIKAFGAAAWGSAADCAAAGLFAAQGAVLGKVGGEILCFDGPEHQLLIGASRSGKGRGHVVPTLLAWPGSALVLDAKRELADGDGRVGFPGTSGFRAGLGPVLRFAPTDTRSAAFNPLFEVRRGESEVRDVQNIVDILVDPAGERHGHDFWDRSAKNILVGVILHVLYAEPPARKTLAVVREKLRDLDATAHVMTLTRHRLGADGRPETHPEVLHAAESYLAGEERLKSGIKATAESFFGLFADPMVAAKTAMSDFRIGDLMCLTRPVTLYLMPPPSDAPRLMPLLRLLLNQIARALMEDQAADATGRRKRHRLLMMLDEFPLLGRMPFFETTMGAMAAYGLKASLVCQSLNHIVRAYGRDNVILDNCHIVTAFAAADGETARRIADMAGEVWEMRDSETRRRPRPVLGWAGGSTTTREERRPLLLPADVRALPGDEELIFVAGAKPIRAKKLKFDREEVFRSRLAAPAPDGVRLTTAHDWIDVAAIGAPSAADIAAARERVREAFAPVKTRSRKSVLAPTSARGQGDLFPAPAVARASSVSARASQGFRDASGAPLPHPADAAREPGAPAPVQTTGM